MLRFVFSALMGVVFLVRGEVAWAQAQVWLQIEARPTLSQAEDRVRAYLQTLSDVNGFRLASGWYAIALGPYAPDDAQVRLARLRANRLVPGDSFVADGGRFRERFFPGEGVALTVPDAPEPVEIRPGEETVSEAREGERLLDREARAELQTALQWEGFYSGAIDASFGRGTRSAMADWQRANGYEATGVLTTLQRREVLTPLREARDSLGLRTVYDSEAGIEIVLPDGLVNFDSYAAPFARYTPDTDDGVEVYLISQRGDGTTLAGLYDVMQTLEIVPMDGERELSRRSFLLTGRNDRIASYTYATLSDGTVKGFTLVWPADDEKRRQLAVEVMQASFTPRDGVLPDTAVSEEQSVNLLAGLRIRRPAVTQSGFYVDGAGRVLTTAAGLAECNRITLDERVRAEVVALDSARGLALLEPARTLAPIQVARLATAQPRLQSEVAVSGYSFGGVLGQATMTFGALADVRGLDGNEDVDRLALSVEDGDAGGPVLDASGAVLGVLLDRQQDGRVLPPDVAFSADVATVASFLAENGVSPEASDPGVALHPADLAQLGADMTVLVGCWR